MDTLDVMKKAEDLGGAERRKALEEVMMNARDMGCSLQIGGGRAGGMNLRYGAIGYAVMDINTKGLVKLYASAHPGKDAPDEYRTAVNSFIEEREELEPKSFPINTYGHLEDTIEEVGPEVLIEFIEHVVRLIRKFYYEPWRELHEA